MSDAGMPAYALIVAVSLMSSLAEETAGKDKSDAAHDENEPHMTTGYPVAVARMPC
jgi:hypothetical protein